MSEAQKAETPAFKAEYVFYSLMIFIPLTLIFKVSHQPAWVTFFSACLGIVPLAGLMGQATEYLAEKVGAGWGGFLNATFGNACEFIIAFSALRAGLFDVVKASITGSIIGNILLVMGASMLFGGLRYNIQQFNRTAATTSATLLALGAISLIVPAIFHHYDKHPVPLDENYLALAISIVLFITYLLSLVFSLKTHKHLYVRELDADSSEALTSSGWGTKTSLLVLAGTTALVAVLSEILVHAVEETAQVLHITQVFIGVILVAIIGNAAEHSAAVLMSLRNKMDLSLNICLGSSAQIALFVAPMLVFCSFAMGKPMDLRFTEFEVMSVMVSVIILAFVAMDGESNWLEGVQLLAVYAIVGAAFYFA